MDLTRAAWRKSSYSTDTNCVEVALTGAVWRKASFSANAGNCVEVARNVPGEPGIVAIRDSKNPDGPNLIITAAAWRQFTTTLRNTTPRLA
jgi:hypothetical protein